MSSFEFCIIPSPFLKTSFRGLTSLNVSKSARYTVSSQKIIYHGMTMKI